MTPQEREKVYDEAYDADVMVACVMRLGDHDKHHQAGLAAVAAAERKPLVEALRSLIKAITIFDNSRMYIGQVQVKDVEAAIAVLTQHESEGE